MYKGRMVAADTITIMLQMLQEMQAQRWAD